jgi:phosphoribosylanthranilate isomerase
MNLKTIIKVSHVTNLSDARYCAGMGVQMLGFCLDKNSSLFIEAKKAQEIASWVVGMKIVGEITSDIETELKDYPLDMLEANTPQTIEMLVQSELHRNAPLIYKMTIDNMETLAFCKEAFATYAPYIDYFLIESNLLSIKAQTMPLLQNLCASYPILLGFGIDKHNVIEILDSLNPKGIALKAGKESPTGLLGIEEVAEIIELLQEEDE